MKLRNVIGLMVALILSFTLVSPPAFTQDAATPGAEQSVDQTVMVFRTVDSPERGLFDLELEPGESATLKVLMGNAGEIPFDGITYAADAYSMVNGGYAIRDLDSPKNDVSTWLEYPTEIHTVLPGQGIEREFTLTVPEGTPAGEYVTGLAWESVEPVAEGEETDADTGFRLDKFQRIVVGVRIVVPGEMAPVVVLGEPLYSAQEPFARLTIPIENTGNQRVELSGTLNLSDTEGNVISEIPLTLGRIYGGHQTEIVFSFQEPLEAGTYSVSLVLQSEDGSVQVELPESSFEVEGVSD